MYVCFWVSSFCFNRIGLTSRQSFDIPTSGIPTNVYNSSWTPPTISSICVRKECLLSCLDSSWGPTRSSARTGVPWWTPASSIRTANAWDIIPGLSKTCFAQLGITYVFYLFYDNRRIRTNFVFCSFTETSLPWPSSGHEGNDWYLTRRVLDVLHHTFP